MKASDLDVTREAVERSKRKSSVQLPIDFARARNEEPTPLKLIAADGRGQGLRLKLYLSMTMLATSYPYDVRPYPASTYARMLAMDDPDGQGARRVNQAQRWLRDAGYIQRIENGTHPPFITMLDLPVTPDDWGGRWLTLPLDLWSNGWIHVMSGRALTLYVVLRELTGGKSSSGDWADGRRKRQYGLSDETWARGTEELEHLGLAEVTSVIDNSDPFARRQPRLNYKLRPEATTQLPAAYQASDANPFER